MSRAEIMGQHDLSYRVFFSHRRMIQDLLREIVGEHWVERIDFDSGQLVSTSFISPEHENRESDLIWKFRRKDEDEWVFVYIFIDFQLSPAPSASERFTNYLGMLYERLVTNRPRELWKRLPLVLPIVVLDCLEPWGIANDLDLLTGGLGGLAVGELFRVEKRRAWWELVLKVDRLRHTSPPDDSTLRPAFEAWLAKVVPPSVSEEEAFETLTLSEIEAVLTERYQPLEP